jgi:hypothetical protein
MAVLTFCHFLVGLFMAIIPTIAMVHFINFPFDFFMGKHFVKIFACQALTGLITFLICVMTSPTSPIVGEFELRDSLLAFNLVLMFVVLEIGNFLFVLSLCNIRMSFMGIDRELIRASIQCGN